ncbi:MAG: hypothetical protein IT222_13270 [Crocinitomix sp.]|nr:hypothetical protein [Crocinitomix sp.]
MIKNNYLVFLYLLIGFMLIVISFSGINSVQIAVHDTYFIFSSQQIFLLLGGSYFLFAGIVWIFKNLNRSFNVLLTWFHLIITTLSIIAILVVNWYSVRETKPRIYSDYSVYEGFTKTSNVPDYNYWLTILICIGVFAQFLFLIALVLALVKAKRSKV